ncbi:MAG TPA: prolyl oligopeptidase family serine peptidase [Casimicrobiaceae bacterium]|nr:prolyl oligopeptidase family serine peptidase [Casimicrobiaceae bacterium]
MTVRPFLPFLPSCVSFVVASSFAAAAGLDYPATPKRPVTEVYHGVTVVDDYRWLEDDASPEVVRWVAEQNALTHRYLNAIPQRPAIARQVGDLLLTSPARRYDFQYRKRLFALKLEPPKNQPSLVSLPASADTRAEHVILDLNMLDPSGRTAIDFYRPSYDGKHVIVSLSKNGSEDGAAYVYDVETGRRLNDEIPGVMYPTAGGSVEWAADGKGFYYTRYPRGNERPPADSHFFQQVYFHKLGTPTADDTYVIGKDFPRIAEIELKGSRNGAHLLAIVRNGDGGEIAYHLRGPDGAWREVAGFKDGLKQLAFGDDGRLYGMSIKDAPRGRIIAIPIAAPSLAQARVVVPEQKIITESVEPTRSRLYVTCMDGGPTLVRMYSLAGKALGELPTPSVSTVAVATRLGGDDVLVSAMSYVSPRAVSRYEARAGRLVATNLVGRYPFSLDDAVVERVFAVSKDGTRVPVSIVHRKDIRLDGNNPTLVYGYGGYGLSMTPWFSPLMRLWLDYGGVYAVANIRGGGEYGEPWHLAGNLTHKQNVFDDFAASIKMLIDRKYTRPDRTAIMGGSNGGLTMGATLVQHPELIRAVVSEVGIYDPLRWELQPNGEFNVTEFGSVKDEAQFRALYAYSPFANARDGVAYPAVLFVSGANDGRVAPYESRKMTARLQAATSSANPILLRTEAAAGHGIGTALSTRIEEETDVYAFLVDQLRMVASPPAAVGSVGSPSRGAQIAPSAPAR